MGVGEAVASVDGKVVAQAELTFMVGQHNDSKSFDCKPWGRSRWIIMP